MKRKLAKHDVPTRNWLVSHELAEEGQVAIFDSESSELLLLNEFGGLIWHQIDGQKDIDSMIETLAELPIEVPSKAEIALQLEAFLNELLAKGAIAIL